MSLERSKISIKEILKILELNFDVKGSIKELVGEVDYNFKVESKCGKNYLLKISGPNFESDYIDFQINLLEYLNKNCEIEITKSELTIERSRSCIVKDGLGRDRCVRLLSWVEGRLWSSVNPINKSLRKELGYKAAILSNSLINFKHSFSKREIEWDISNSLWVEDHLDKFDTDQKKILKTFIIDFKKNLPLYNDLTKSIIHNDINDNNIIVSNDLLNPSVKSIIDFGDSVYTQTINDLAVTCSYGIMNVNDPLAACCEIISGYNNISSITDNELKLLYNLIAMRLVISVTKSLINRFKEPDNKYLLVSEKPAWELLKKWVEVDSEFAYYSYRKACDLNAHPEQNNFYKWALENRFSVTDLFSSIKKNKLYKIDLSVGSKWIGGRNEIEDLELFQYKIEKLQKKYPDKIITGGYLEPRSIYSSNSYEKIGNYGDESRTIHLGLDFWLPPGTKVNSMFDGEIVVAVNDKGHKEYGGLLILKHNIQDLEFYTLYGHNTVESVLKNKVGSKVKKGDVIAEIGNYPENGNWAPHLHFQIILSMLNYKIDYPGVCYFNQMEIWKDLCPDPNLLFKSIDLDNDKHESDEELIKYRHKNLGKSLKLHYDKPIHIVRGEGVYLIDYYGRKYLDTVNNVAHVGHENESVVSEGQNQMSILNTNSRYLHKNINDFTKELLKTLPKELSIVHFVNSGSEANELAVRMMKSHTGENDIIVSEHGYHGNTNICVDISSYKFDGKGGNGAPEHTHVIPMPSKFNGKYQGENSVDDYVGEIEKCIENIKTKKRKLGGFIIEPIISCGGQVELPKGFLKKSYEIIRKNGGICISDEVQVGCGRLGKSFWGFQLHDVVPDIITIGKPLGNGHPIGAVVCTKEIAESFANGMEFFNTFGGNPVSCSIATQVLKVVENQNLQENAKIVGEYFKKELKKLTNEFDLIGDVRGQGLFLGIELIDQKMNSLQKKTKYIINRLKKFGILSNLDGPKNNVIKIKPPLTFHKDNCDKFIFYIRKILKEDYLNK
ncbi:MAG: aminotransferase class III-fold pyridoxal phosphate-dependent enzyme [Cryomorphaceae bacterium]|jgi:4-aminobutyrate aminotransferase-like enzyme/Ser/Thr protein kinase RdoA (MazF antagonist)|nr:aminotransferase class III-fold pyridoxal phosphate-dependent enzyme [Cryomorphaceae bacterium]MBT3689406.1 aminotransferase class III-fold pyridoxal phosphate-dependent enzyme [Cryomorphaceae bacterium]MBT4221874.1 aminotransferase class III-fold pyridoxal phosphate-dependent enzyme [Cryomorphaceae bacterium]MBT4294127.1 aminotransferase class III-fold pyridoxal phosphate-dependent enzyme [Cryomorphaceae bacterium]MBT4517777.1 aminotransferase class III-fold pyridoxal phosphate-dependent en